MKWNEDSALRSAWRRIFSRSPIVIEVMKAGKRYVPKFNSDGSRSKKDSVEFLCNVCKKWVKASVGGKGNVAVDHIIPVISTENTEGKVQDWNLFKSKLFCAKSNLQIICKTCHIKKSNEERNKRNALKDQVALSNLEINIQSVWTIPELKNLKKQIAKFLTKKKSPETKERATKLKQLIIDKIEKED
jgi:hypothetical protein